jgi:hypothetical protein
MIISAIAIFSQYLFSHKSLHLAIQQRKQYFIRPLLHPAHVMRKGDMGSKLLLDVPDACDRVPRSGEILLERCFAAVGICPEGDVMDAIEEFPAVSIRVSSLAKLIKSLSGGLECV